jgi:hypothetical protein
MSLKQADLRRHQGFRHLPGSRPVSGAAGVRVLHLRSARRLVAREDRAVNHGPWSFIGWPRTARVRFLAWSMTGSSWNTLPGVRNANQAVDGRALCPLRQRDALVRRNISDESFRVSTKAGQSRTTEAGVSTEGWSYFGNWHSRRPSLEFSENAAFAQQLDPVGKGLTLARR